MYIHIHIHVHVVVIASKLKIDYGGASAMPTGPSNVST